MSEESEIRVERIKTILEFQHDVDLARLCECYPRQVSIWRNKGLTKPVERLLDALLDRYDQDRRAKTGRPPKLSVGQRIRRARRDRRLSQKDLAEMIYGGEGFSENALRMRGSRLEKLEAIDDDTLEKVAQALGMGVDEI